VSSGKTEGRLPRRSSILKTSSFIVHLFLPFPLFHRGASRNFCERFPNLHRHCPQPGAPIALSLGHSTKKQAELHTNSEGEASPWLHRRRGPQCGSAAGQCYAQFPPHANEEGEVRTGNDECALQSSTKRKEKEAEEEGTSGASSPFVRRNGEKPGIFAE